MKYFKLLLILIIILSFLFPGCMEKSSEQPTITTTPEKQETPTTTTAAATPDVTSNVRIPSIYKSYVDDVYGFFRVISISQEASSAPYDKENKTLTIHTGDTVIWVNDADERLTIISEQGLWDMNTSRSRLLYQTSEFNYTFTQPGTYDVYIREYPRLSHLKINVNQ
jgi:plastocyanin